jgi:hypothetical protein
MPQESDIERKLKQLLEDEGFKVLKLYTPGHTGVMDRMILRPKYSPGAPMFVELKKDGKKLRPLQIAIGSDWIQRGCKVLRPITTMHECIQQCEELIRLVAIDKRMNGNDLKDLL